MPVLELKFKNQSFPKLLSDFIFKTCPFSALLFDIENLKVMHGNLLSFLRYFSSCSVLNLITSNKLISHF